MKLKRFLLILSTICVAMMIWATGVMAVYNGRSNMIYMTPSKYTASPGDVITITFKAYDMVPYYCFTTELLFDESIKNPEITLSSRFPHHGVEPNIQDGSVRIIWSTDCWEYPFTLSGQIATMKFKIPNDAETGQYDFDFSCLEWDTFPSNGMTGPADLDKVYEYNPKYDDDITVRGCSIWVNGNTPVDRVDMNESYLPLQKGNSRKLYASCYPNNASNKKITWSSSNTNVAYVDANGNVFAKNIGVAIIEAKTANGKLGTCKVVVTNTSYDKYGYSFTNSRSNFGYGDYYVIPEERYMQLGMSKPIAKEYVEKAKEKGKDGWYGNCFGMGVSSILFYKNILKEENYKSDVHYPNDFKKPNAGNNAFLWDKWEVKLRHMIELFQVSQELPIIRNYLYYFEPSEVVSELDRMKPVLLWLDTASEGSHTVVIYNYLKLENGYKFFIYDCSKYVTAFTYVDKNNWFFDYQNPKYAWRPVGVIKYDTMERLYNKLYTENNNGAASLFSLLGEPTNTYMFTSVADMTITNSQGQISTISNGEVSGDIEGISVNVNSYMAEEKSYTIILPTDTYTIVGEGDEVISTSFADDYMSAEVTAKASTPITISVDLHDITVEGVEDDDYSIRYTTYDNIFDEMTLSGVASGTTSSSLKETSVVLSGVKSVSATATVSETGVSAECENTEGYDELTVQCEEEATGATIQIVSAENELSEKQALPEREQVSVPEYDLESGEYTEGQMLSFTKDDDTIIYYTTDGSIPSIDNGFIYSMPIEINKTMTVKAISTKYGYSDSEVLTLDYVLSEIKMPQASHRAGYYDEIITVELFAELEDDEIYYTLDESDPTTDGILYTVPIVITEDTVLKIYAVRNGCVSEVNEYDYQVSHSQLFYFSNSLTNQEGGVITAENIGSLTQIKSVLTRLQEGEHEASFIAAFYNADGKLLYVTSKTDKVDADVKEVIIDIDGDISDTATIKVLAWDSLTALTPKCNLIEENLYNTL